MTTRKTAGVKITLTSLGAGMKLHEKILAHFQSCTSPVDKEGFLYKKVWMNKVNHGNLWANGAITFFLHRKSGTPPTIGGGSS